MDTDKSNLEKDTSYTPASDSDTEALQNTTVPPTTGASDPEVDYDKVKTLPGTGGPDDEGDIEIDLDEVPFPVGTKDMPA